MRRFRKLKKFLISVLLLVVTVISTITPTTAYAADNGGYYTHSPLLDGNTVAIDELNPWELECFAIFMSNFCVPFVDTFVSAFNSAETTQGSKGAGLQALQFATGGDISADSIVRRMTTMVIDSLASQYKPLVVKNYAIDGKYNGELTEKKNTLGTSSPEYNNEYRGAVLADLLPLVHFVDAGQDNLGTIPDFDYDTYPQSVWNHAWVAGITSTSKDDAYTDLTITHGVLGKFYLTNDTNTMELIYKEPVFDMTNGWDVQIPSNCLLYALYRDNGAHTDAITTLLNNAATLPLVMDSIGNICTLVNSQAIVIIPAYLNQHLLGTGLGTINLLGSVFINSLCSSTDKLTIAAGTIAPRANHNGSTSDQQPLLNAGLGQLVYNGSSVAPGTSFLYNTYTDYVARTSLYGKPATGDPYYKKIHTTEYNNFLNSGFDLIDHLRWSTSVHYSAGGGFSMQDYTSGTTPGDDDYSKASSLQNFSYTNVWGKVKSDAKDMYEAASAFQTAAQLYAANTTTNLTDIKCYYKTLKDTTNTDLISGINNVTKEADKNKLVYIPCGADVSGAINNLITYREADKWQNTYKQLAACAVDTYHGAGPVELDATQRNQVTSPISGLNLDTWIMLDLLTKDGGKKLYKYITGTDDIPSEFTSTAYTSSGWKTCEAINVQWARIAPATAFLKTAASYLGLRQDCTFSLYASDMYYSYLHIYGLTGEETEKSLFNSEVFAALDSACVSLTAEQVGQAIMTHGLTAEQKEQMMKENAYLMLSTGEDGKEYRSRMIDGMMNEWLVEVYDNTCYGDTDSDYFQTLNSTSTSFLNLRTYSENFLTKAVVSRWGTLLPVIMLILSLIVVVLGTLNNKKIPWVLCNLVICACMLITLPALSETIPYVVEKISDTAFENVIDTMAVSEAVEDDIIRADIKKQFAGYDQKIQDAVDSLGAFGTSGSLMLKQDITRKVIPQSTSSVYSELKGLASAQWLLPNLLAMTGADSQDTLNDYVYRAVGEKRTELRKLAPKFEYIDNAVAQINRARAAYGHTGGRTAADFKTQLPGQSYARGASSEHTYGLILTDLNGTGLNGMSIAPAFIHQTTNTLIGGLSSYNDDYYETFAGYLQGTETLLPYFYLVAKDALKNTSGNELFEQVTMQDYYNAIRHTSSTQHTNHLTVSGGKTIDILDLEYLFDDYLPYLMYMQETAKANLGDAEVGHRYKIYEEEPQYFLYKCNWADKIYNAYNYSKEELNPHSSTYRGRKMVFSESQLFGTGLDPEQLTDIELACIEVNKQVDKAWTLLVNYIAIDGVSMDILAEQMAITATIIFNNVVSQDRVVSSNYALYPSAISLRTINFDTMMKMVLMSNYGMGDFNQQSMRIVLAESGLLSGLILLATAWLATVLIPLIMDICLAVIFYAAILACAYNACIDGKEKLKTFGGASMSVGIITAETALYVYSYAWIIGDTNKVLSATQMAAGNSLATSKLFILLIVTLLYGALLVFHTITSVINFKDMSFQMWASYSQKSFNAAAKAMNRVRTGFSNIRNGIKATSGDPEAVMSLMRDNPIPVKVQDKMQVSNSAKDPLFTKESNSSAEATYLFVEEGSSDSGYILNSKHRDEDLPTPKKKPTQEETEQK